MASFTQVYKQELKNKGVLSSLGSAALKSQKERMDIKNILFGGKGFIGATGQKIFGKGYSALSGSPSVSNVSDSASADLKDLTESTLRQELMLKIVAKNTMNMNFMARDMNITRQNIATLTKKLVGKSSRGADALFYGAGARSRMTDTREKKDNLSPTKETSSTSLIGSIVGGLIGFVGSAGTGILGALGTIVKLSPILGIIALSGAAYVIKKLAEMVDFGEIKNSIFGAIGYDPASSKSFVQQMAEKLDEVFKTTKFSDSLQWVMDKFGPTFDSIGRSIAKITDVTMVYIKAAYQTLADSVANTGRIVGFLFNEFFQSNKGKIYAAIAAGLAIGYGGKSAVGALAALGAVGLAGLFGSATGEGSRDELPDMIEEKKKQISVFLQKNFENQPNALQNAIERRSGRGLWEQNLSTNQKQLLAMYDAQIEMEKTLERKNKQWNELVTPNLGGKFQQYIEEGRSALPGGTYGGGYASSSSPTKMSGILSNTTWSQLSESEKEALLTAQANAEGFGTAGAKTITQQFNPGAMKYSGWMSEFGGEPGNNGFAKFPTLAQGRAAQRRLWDMRYANVPLTQAIKDWTEGPNAEMTNDALTRIKNYEATLARGISMVPGDSVAKKSMELFNAQRTQGVGQASAPVTVNNQQNVTNSQAITADKATVGDNSLWGILGISSL